MQQPVDRQVILAFIAPANLRRLSDAIIPRMNPDDLLCAVVDYTKEIREDLRWSTPLAGVTIQEIVAEYNREFIRAHSSKNHQANQPRRGTLDVPAQFVLSDGAPVSRASYEGVSTDMLLDRWWLGGAANITLRDDRVFDRFTPRADQYTGDPYYSERNPRNAGHRYITTGDAMKRPKRIISHREVVDDWNARAADKWLAENGLTPRAEDYLMAGNTPEGFSGTLSGRQMCGPFHPMAGGLTVQGGHQGPSITQDYHRSVFTSSTADQWNATAEPHERVALGVTSQEGDDRLASRNLTRKTMSGLENGIRRMEHRLYKRHYDVEAADDGLDTTELSVPTRGQDMSNIRNRLEVKRLQKWRN